MSPKKSLKERIDKYFYEHKKTKEVIQNIYAIIMVTISALVFSFGDCPSIYPS